MSQPRSRIAYIDALRALAITAVIATHAARIWPGLPDMVRPIALLGTNGVQLFFVASALTLLLSNARRNDGAAAFYIRRFFRIAPMFWLAIALYLLLDRLFTQPFWSSGTVDWHTILLTIFFSHGWSPEAINAVVPGGWTIAVEMMFYLAFPLLAASVTSLNRAILFLVASILLAIDANSLTADAWPADRTILFGEFLYYWLPNSLPCFAIGFVAFYLLPYAPRTRLGSLALLLGAGLVALYVAFGPLPFFATGTQPLARGTVFALACLLLILALQHGNYPLLVNRAVCFLGRVSYSGYLTHWVLVELALLVFRDFHTGPVASTILWLASILVLVPCTAALSFLTYSLIERPGIGAGARMVDALRGAPVPEPNR